MQVCSLGYNHFKTVSPLVRDNNLEIQNDDTSENDFIKDRISKRNGTKYKIKLAPFSFLFLSKSHYQG